MGYPRGLIRYSTENAMQHGWSWRRIFARTLRPRVLVYGALLAAIGVAGSVALWMRVPLKVDVIRDRGSLAREVEGGRIENVYRLQLMNTEERSRKVTLGVTGPGLTGLELLTDAQPLELAPTQARSIAVRVRAEPGPRRGSQPIEFTISSAAEGGGRSIELREKSRFLVP
jgi:polyferredoxin